jgi:hypothetical protein
MSVPDAVHAAIREWMRDATIDEPWHGPDRAGELLVQYLWQAGFRIAPIDTPRVAALRRARLKGTHTDAQWQAMLDWAGDACVCCGGPSPQKDHVVAVSQDGDDSIENIQPLCGPCNVRKRDKYADYRHSSWRVAVLGEPVS